MASTIARSAYALRRFLIPIISRRQHARSCVTRTTGEGSGTETVSWKPEGVNGASPPSQGATDLPSDEMTFPDGRDPLENPLAPMSHDNMQHDVSYWKRRRTPQPKVVYKRKLDADGFAHGRGGRKRSNARVWIREGNGCVTVNGASWVDYFTRVDQRDKILRPMHLLGMTGKFDVHCYVSGGGETGQAEAIRFSLARALQNWQPDWRSVLKKDGLMTRDSRIVEMKKYGKKKARKSFQWVKR